MISRYAFWVCIGMAATIFAGCSATKSLNSATSEKIRIIERTELKPMVVFTEIPRISQMVETKDSSSHLENEYAVSDAGIDRRGNLHHTLATKPQKRPGTVYVPEVHRDSTVYVEVEKIVEKEIPVKLSWWQELRLKGFWILFGLLVFAYRKCVMKLLRVII